MSKTNKKTYLVTKDEFNRKAFNLKIFVSYVCNYSTGMMAKVGDFIYVPITYYCDGEFVEFLVNNSAELIEYVEKNFIGRWAV